MNGIGRRKGEGRKEGRKEGRAKLGGVRGYYGRCRGMEDGRRGSEQAPAVQIPHEATQTLSTMSISSCVKSFSASTPQSDIPMAASWSQKLLPS